MSIFDNDAPVREAISMDDAARGPRLGFMGAFDQAYHTQLLTAGTYRVEAALREQEAQQIALAKQYGADLSPVSDRQPLGSFAVWNSDPYWRASKGLPAQNDPSGAPITAANDKILTDLQQKHPQAGFKTYAQQTADVASNAQGAAADYANSTWDRSGHVGGLLGMFAASANLRYNNALPVAAGLTPIGRGMGAVAGAAARVGFGGALGGVQGAVSNLTGDNQESQVLGMPSQSFGQAVGEGVMGGLAMGAVGETAGAALHLGGRWFERGPNEPEPPTPPSEVPQAAPETPASAAPEPPIYGPEPAGEDAVRGQAYEAQPLGPSREAVSRVDQDLSATSAQLDQWDGPGVGDADGFAADASVATPEARADAAASGADLDEIARRVDPPVVGEFQRLGQQMGVIRQQIDHMNGLDFATFNDAEIEGQRAALRQLDEQVAQLETQQQQSTSRKNAQRLRDQADDLYAQRRSLEDLASRATSTEAMARRADAVAELRSRLIDMDERRRDLAPLVTRAYRVAREQRSSGPDIAEPAPHEMPEETARTIPEQVQATEDRAAAVTDEAIGRMREPEPAAQPEPQEPGVPPPLDRDEIQLPSGRTVRLDDVAEAIRDENEAGGVRATKTVRQMLAELEEDKALDAASRFCAL